MKIWKVYVYCRYSEHPSSERNTKGLHQRETRRAFIRETRRAFIRERHEGPSSERDTKGLHQRETRRAFIREKHEGPFLEIRQTLLSVFRQYTYLSCFNLIDLFFQCHCQLLINLIYSVEFKKWIVTKLGTPVQQSYNKEYIMRVSLQLRLNTAINWDDFVSWWWMWFNGAPSVIFSRMHFVTRIRIYIHIYITCSKIWNRPR